MNGPCSLAPCICLLLQPKFNWLPPLLSTPIPLQNVLIVIGSLVYATWALYYTALAILPLLAIFVFMWHYFRALARDSNRFESTTLSPVLNSFGNSLTGVTIIRAYGMSNTVLSKLEDLMDLNSSWLKICKDLLIFFELLS